MGIIHSLVTGAGYCAFAKLQRSKAGCQLQVSSFRLQGFLATCNLELVTATYLSIAYFYSLLLLLIRQHSPDLPPF